MLKGVNKLRAIALPMPKPNPCFIESTIEGPCEAEGKGTCKGEGKGTCKGEGAGAGIFCFVWDDLLFEDLGMHYKE